MSISDENRTMSKNGKPVDTRSNGAPQIVHFDATTVRKNKMRKKALEQSSMKKSTERPLVSFPPLAESAIPPAPSVRSTEFPAASFGNDHTTTSTIAATEQTSATSTPPTSTTPSANSSSATSSSGAQPVQAKKSAPPPEQLETFLINFVVEQTGYPAEIVDLDADLEADLGIDSIKKAQLFGELREFFDIMPTADMTLDDFPTLRHVSDFLGGSSKSLGENKNIGDDSSTETISTGTEASTVVTLNSNTPPQVGIGTPYPTSETAVKPQGNAPAPDQLEPFLINFVVEQTGYPAEIVEMDADLEADLGIDSIKKAQLFGELREYFEITPTEDLTLDDFPTLRDVMNFLQGSHSNQKNRSVDPPDPMSSQTNGENPARVESTAAPPSAATTEPADKAAVPDQLEPFLINFVVEQTGYPAEIVEMDADLEADLGIDSIKKAQLFGELREYFDMTPTEDLTLDDFPTLRDVMNFLQGIHTKQQTSASPITATENSSSATAMPISAGSPVEPANHSEADGTIRAKENTPPPEQLESFLINFVVEQTGYPPEIVEMDADLEADLGIDSIKKAQLFGELREYFEITPTEDLTLDDFTTLRDVMSFLQGTHLKSKTATDATVRSSPASSTSDPSANGNGKPIAMNVTDILQTISLIIIERNMADTAKADLTSSTRLIDDVGLDSVGMLDLITAVEKQFGITISLEDLEIESLNNSGTFAALIERKLGETF